MEKERTKFNYLKFLWPVSLMALTIFGIVITQNFFLRYTLVLWLCFMILWAILSFRTKENNYEQNIKKMNTFRIIVIVGIIVMSLPIANPPFLHIIAQSPITALVGFIMTLLGIPFAIWARFILGTNWSGKITFKKDHELITKGPYALVRHPMYTGVLTALWGLFVILGGLVHLIFFALVTYGFIKKMNAEEVMLTENLKGYKEYKEKTKKLIPFVY